MKTTGFRTRSMLRSSATAVTLGIVAITAIPANAQTAPTPSRTPAAGPDRHCVVHPDNAQTCYSSFRRAMADATGGQITNAPDSGRAAATDAALDARINDLAKHASKAGTAARRPVVVGIEWSNRDARGSSWIIEFFDRCRRGYYFVRNLGGNWWNDRISSYKSYAGCRVNHYENQNARGSSTGWHYGYVSYIGNAMNDQTSSVMWSS